MIRLAMMTVAAVLATGIVAEAREPSEDWARLPLETRIRIDTLDIRGDAERLDALRIVARGGAIFIKNVHIQTGRRRTESLAISRRIEGPRDGFVIDLPGRRSRVSGVEVEYYGVGFPTLYGKERRRSDWEPVKLDVRSKLDVLDFVPNMGRFSAARVVAVERPINVYKLTLKLSDGSVRNFRLNDPIRPGDSSRAIDFGGSKVVIQRAEIEYSGGGYPILQGRVAPEDGMNLIGVAEVNTKSQAAKFAVSRGERAATALRLRAWISPIRIRSLEIEFGNGERQRVRVRDELRPGEVIDVDLEGYRRRVANVIVDLRPTRGDKEAARLDLLAKDTPRRRQREKGSRWRRD